MQQTRLVKDVDGNILSEDQLVRNRWKGYFETLMNTENERQRRGKETIEETVGNVQNIEKAEVKRALMKMKNRKAVGPDNIPVEVWKSLGEVGEDLLTRLFNDILRGGRMPDECRRSTLIPIFKNKGDILECGNYRGIKLLSHTMKVWESIVDGRIRKEVVIGEQQYGFMPGRSTNDALFALRRVLEKYREGQRDLTLWLHRPGEGI